MKIRTLFLFLLVLFFACLAVAKDRPNVVFILVDDLGRTDIGVDGSTFYETPNIDRLANSGMRFTDGYATCQVCSPSRASILTGKYTPRHGITDWIGAASGLKWNRNDRILPAEYNHNLPAEDITLAEAMRAGGYKTFYAGKWHLGTTGSPYKNPKLEDGPLGESLPMRLASETCNFIEANAKGDFFAYLSFYSVHGPIQTSEEFWKKYRDKAAAAGLAENRFKNDRTKAVRQVQDNPIYAGMMESLDNAVGMVVDKLKELGIDDETVVIFTSDNGGVSSGDAFSTSLLPYRGGKGRQWEGGIRVPFYIKVPNVTKAGSVCDTPVISTDFYPTILELAGLGALEDQHVDGVSLVSVLKGDKLAKRDLFWHYPHYGNQGGEPSVIVRSGKWKLIRYYEDGRNELYDLSKDIGEVNDLVDSEPKITKRLGGKVDAWLKETGAKIPVADIRFDAVKKEKQLENSFTKGLESQEKYYRNVQRADWKPNKDWWGSGIAKD